MTGFKHKSHRAAWTDEQVAYLAANADADILIMMADLGRSKSAIRKKLSDLGIPRRALIDVAWQPVEDKYIADNYQHETYEAMAYELRRSYSATRKRLYVLRKQGIVDGYATRQPRAAGHTEKLDDKLLESVKQLGIRLTAERFGRTIGAVRSRILRIKHGRGIPVGEVDLRPWSKADHLVLFKDWPTSSLLQLANKLGRTRGAVASQVRKLQHRGVLCRKKEIKPHLSRGAGHAARCADGPRSGSLPSVSINAQRS